MNIMTKSELIKSLKKKGFPDKIISAFEKVKREKFVPENLQAYAYEDIALPIEDGSSISQPYTVAFMLDLLDLKQGQKILEIGSGSGYALALISEIIKSGKIYGIEINKRLAIKSKKALAKDSNIEIISRSGFSGLPQFAPYDRILISASAPQIPRNLYSQLKDPGIIVAAVKQSIYKITKQNGNIEEKEFPGFAFVPLQNPEKK